MLFDVLGTLVRLRPPGEPFHAGLAARGIEVSKEDAERGMRAEIAYYMRHQIRGRDMEAVERLRSECAAEIGRELGLGDEHRDAVREAMMEALVFEPFPDTVAALRALRESGLTLVAASNWDVSLPEWLDRAGLAGLLHGAASSAEAGAQKPDPAVVLRALELADCAPGEAIFVGDQADTDLAAGEAAGVRSLLVVREGEPPPGAESIRSLSEIASVISRCT